MHTRTKPAFGPAKNRMNTSFRSCNRRLLGAVARGSRRYLRLRSAQHQIRPRFPVLKPDPGLHAIGLIVFGGARGKQHIAHAVPPPKFIVPTVPSKRVSVLMEQHAKGAHPECLLKQNLVPPVRVHHSFPCAAAEISS
jgi:hypothetical protein